MKWLVTWNCGYYDETEIVEADTESEAQDIAYRNWLEDAESNASYDAQELTGENILDHGLEHEFSDAELIDFGLVFDDEIGCWELND